MFRSPISKSLHARAYQHSSIPFDLKPFPFRRFEPCCPDLGSPPAPNGYLPCKTHTIPNALGKKIELEESMTRPNSLRHVVGCIGYEAAEWTRSHCDSIPGIMQSLDKTRAEWLKTSASESSHDKQVLFTVAEREPSSLKKPDMMFFPEFKMINSIDISQGLINQQSPLYPVMDALWKNPNRPLPENILWQDIEVDTVVFVCTHGRRDMRCGYLGPPIVAEFNEIAKKKGLKLEAWGTSHFGGHKFAGNIIIHQRGLGGHIYGNVRACHVKDIVDRHIIHGKVIKELWRGSVTPPSFD